MEPMYSNHNTPALTYISCVDLSRYIKIVAHVLWHLNTFLPKKRKQINARTNKFLSYHIFCSLHIFWHSLFTKTESFRIHYFNRSPFFHSICCTLAYFITSTFSFWSSIPFLPTYRFFSCVFGTFKIHIWTQARELFHFVQKCRP